MKIENTYIEGLFVIKNRIFKDDRGIFVKTYNNEIFSGIGLNLDFKESYYSISKKNVIRGMHFQLTPYDHEKLVYVPKGKVLDVVLDLRKKSKTYGKVFSIEISKENKVALFIPKGCAHGFKSLENDTIMLYNVTTVYNNKYDSGVKWDSFGFDWDIKDPIISERDRNFVDFKNLNSPF